MNIWDKIKLIIEARSFYVKRIFIHQIEFGVLSSIPGREEWHLKNVTDWLRKNYDSEIKRVLRYDRDERRLGWIVWYI